MERPDAVVVGSGPNGLSAALTLARAGRHVEVYEGAATVGGGTRTEELTLEGFRHDVCAAVHPTLVASPFFRSLDLVALGVVLRQPELPFAHPLGGGRAAALYRDVEQTASHLGGDAAAYRALVGPLVEWLDRIVEYVFSPMRSVPRDPLALARFALVGTRSVRRAARGFSTDAARALLAGASAHSMQPLTAPLTAAFGLLLTALGHGAGWPVVEGGARRSRRDWPASCAARAASCTPGTGSPRWPSYPRAGRAARHDAAPVRGPGGVPAHATAPRARGLASAPGRAPARWTGPSTARCPGVPRRAGAR